MLIDWWISSWVTNELLFMETQVFFFTRSYLAKNIDKATKTPSEANEDVFYNCCLQRMSPLQYYDATQICNVM